MKVRSVLGGGPRGGSAPGRGTVYCIEVCGEGAYGGARVVFRGDTVESVEVRGPFSDASDARTLLGELGWTPRDPAVLVLPRREGLVRRVRVPSTDRRQIALMVPYEAGAHVPWPADEAAVGYQMYPDGTEYTQLLLVVVQKALVEEHVERLRGFGIEIVRVELSTLSLARLVQHSAEPLQNVTILSVRPHGSEYLRVSGGVPVFSRGAGTEESPEEMLGRSYGLDRRKSGGEAVRSSLIIVPDECSDGVVERRAETLGLSVQPLTSLGLGNGSVPSSGIAAAAVGAAFGLRNGASTADLLPERAARRLALRSVARQSRMLVVAVLWLMGVLYGLGSHYLNAERERAQRDRAQIEALGEEAQALLGQFEQLQQLSGEREEVSYPLRVVLDLYELTPADVVINELTYDTRGTVVMGGEAQSYPALFAYLKSLRQSELLRNVQLLQSATPRMGGGSRVDFKVSSGLATRKGPKE